MSSPQRFAATISSLFATALLTPPASAEVIVLYRHQEVSTGAFITFDSDEAVGLGAETVQAAISGDLQQASTSLSASLSLTGADSIDGFSGSGSASVTLFHPTESHGTYAKGDFTLGFRVENPVELDFDSTPIPPGSWYDINDIPDCPVCTNHIGIGVRYTLEGPGFNLQSLNENAGFVEQLAPGDYTLLVSGFAAGDEGISDSLNWNFSGMFTPVVQEFIWANPAGGSFSEAANWEGGVAPGAGDRAQFDLDGAYLVHVAEPIDVEAIEVNRGDVSLDLTAGVINTDQLLVGVGAPTATVLRLDSLDAITAQTIQIGSLEAGVARIVVGSLPPVAPASAPSASLPAIDAPDRIARGVSSAQTNVAIALTSSLELNDTSAEFNELAVVAPPTPLPMDYPQYDPSLNLNSSGREPVTITAKTLRLEPTSRSTGDEAGTGPKVGVIMTRRDVLPNSWKMDVKVEKAKINSSLQIQNSNMTAIGINLLPLSGVGGAPIALGAVAEPTLEIDMGAELLAEDGALVEVAAGEATAVGLTELGRLSILGGSTYDGDAVRIGEQATSRGEVSVGSDSARSFFSASTVDVAVAGEGLFEVLSGADAAVAGVLTVSDPLPAPFSSGLPAGITPGPGLLRVEGDGTLTADQIVIGENGTLSGTGAVTAANGVSFSGKIAPGASPGRLSIVGDVTQLPGGELEIEIGGTVPAVLHDVLDIDGAFSGMGSVRFKFVDGFSPSLGDEFEFLQATGPVDLSGVTFLVDGLAPGFEYEITTTGARIGLTALTNGQFVPEPAGLLAATLLAALSGLHGRRR